MIHPTRSATRGGGAARGVVASIGASVLFGVLFILPPTFDSLSGTEVFGWRVMLTLPLVALIFVTTRQWSDVVAVTRRLRARPALTGVLVIDGLLLGVQLWLFGWAPQSGHGLDASLGYLLLPLVMVVLGMLVHGEKLSLTRGAAVAAAACGVVAALILDGGLSWATLVVAVGYPLYFTLRARSGLDSSGALCLELLVLTPIALWFLATESALTALARDPALILAIALFGLVSAVALVAYLAASRLLPFGLFGLLTYLEPVLLVVVSVTLLGEHAAPSDAFVYGPIVVALALLGIEPLRDRRTSQADRATGRSSTTPAPAASAGTRSP